MTLRSWRHPAMACLAVAALSAAALMADFCLTLVLIRSPGLASCGALMLCTALGLLFSAVGAYAAIAAFND